MLTKSSSVDEEFCIRKIAIKNSDPLQRQTLCTEYEGIYTGFGSQYPPKTLYNYIHKNIYIYYLREEGVRKNEDDKLPQHLDEEGARAGRSCVL